MRLSIALLALCFAVLIVSAQQPLSPAHEIARPETTSGSVSAQDAQALREDIQRMKALVYQMERNLASISSAQDPLKHQFQLEIEMWQLEIARAERRLEAPAPAK